LTLGGVVLTVNGDGALVERRLAGGELACPGCGGVLGGWGHARPRPVRVLDRPDAGLVPRRSRCRQRARRRGPGQRPGPERAANLHRYRLRAQARGGAERAMVRYQKPPARARAAITRK